MTKKGIGFPLLVNNSFIGQKKTFSAFCDRSVCDTKSNSFAQFLKRTFCLKGKTKKYPLQKFPSKLNKYVQILLHKLNSPSVLFGKKQAVSTAVFYIYTIPRASTLWNNLSTHTTSLFPKIMSAFEFFFFVLVRSYKVHFQTVSWMFLM